jgi:hypothetical protein
MRCIIKTMSNTNTDAMAAFLARGGTVTQCPARDGNATPLRILRREASAMLAHLDSEAQAERSQERFGAARLNGASVSDALDESR